MTDPPADDSPWAPPPVAVPPTVIPPRAVPPVTVPAATVPAAGGRPAVARPGVARAATSSGESSSSHSAGSGPSDDSTGSKPSADTFISVQSRADLLLRESAYAGAPVSATCRDLGKVYRTEDEEVSALTEVSKEFLRGALTAIVGPSGSGKSSLLRILACLDRPTSGSAQIDGVDVVTLSVRGRRRLRRRSVAYMFQNPIENLVEYLPARAQLDLNARLRHRPSTAQECAELLDRLGLGHRMDHYPVQMSGGEQQRLAVGCAVIGQPAIVLADEPTAELDSASADLVLDAFAALSDLGVAFLLSSHDPKVVERAGHLLRLDHGRVTESW